MVLHQANLSPRDHDLLRALTSSLRVLSIEQVAGHWFASAAGPRRAAWRRLGLRARLERLEVLFGTSAKAPSAR